MVRVDLKTGIITNLRNDKSTGINGFSQVQLEIYQKGDLLKL